MKYPRGCSGNGSTNGSSSIISVNPRCSMHFLTINSRWYSWVSAVPEIPQVRPGPAFDTHKVKILDTSCCACILDNQAPTQNKIQDQLHRHLAKLWVGMSFFRGIKSWFFSILAENRLKYRENGAVDLIFNYWGKIKIVRNFYDGRNFCQIFLGDHRGVSGAFWNWLQNSYICHGYFRIGRWFVIFN